jgi:Fe-Mn family superoxide dismutase
MGRARASALGPDGTDLPGFQAQEALKTMKKDGRTVYTPKSFDHLRGLTGLSDAQVTEHLDLYAGYVKQVNSLVQELSEMRAERGQTGKDFSLAEGTRRLAYEYDGMVLHELYFSNLKPGGEARPTDRQGLGRALTESY